MGAVSAESMPAPNRPEVAFAGRSNVGKSSLMNALTGQKGLAHVSKTPGRTQQLNFFNLGDKMWLVDMPGYGFAAANAKAVAGWNKLIRGYLRHRVNLRRVCLLVDSRHGLKPADVDVLKLLDEAGVSTQVVLTKVDEPKPDELKACIEAVEKALKKHPAALPTVLPVSSHTRGGIEELRDALADLLKA